MKKTLLSSLIAALLLSGCGGGGDSGSSTSPGANTPVNAPNWLLKVTENSRAFTLPRNENVIYNGCIGTRFYDSTGKLIGGLSLKSSVSQVLPKPVPAGNYTVLVDDLFGSGLNSEGILYYQSSGYAVDNLVFSQQYNISAKSAKLLKFSLNETRSITTSTSWADIYIYDSNLDPIKVGVTGFPDPIYSSNPVILTAGTYYVAATTQKCNDAYPGVFSLIDLGKAS